MQLVVCLAFVFVCSANGAGLKEEFTWTRLDYVWPRESRFGYRPNRPNKVSHLPTGGFVFPDTETTSSKPETGPETPSHINYIYENNVPMGANRWKDKLFVTVPRRRDGVPSTLNYVPMNSTERHNVPLTPYPDWETNVLGGKGGQDHLVSVYRLGIDVCDRLWMVDTGLIEIPGNGQQLQPPAVVIFDLNTDKQIRRFNLPPEVLKGSSLASITVDVTATTCDDAYAYIPDLAGYGLIVYSFKTNDAWRVNHNYFFLESLSGEFTIGGHSFQWNDGIFSIALSVIQADGFRTAYFHSMAGTHLFSISTRILRTKNLATRSYHEQDFKVVGDRGKGSQTSASDLHKKSGVLFLGLVNQNAVGCWNTNNKFNSNDFVTILKDDVKMIYPCDMKVYGDEVIVLSNRMPVFLYGSLNYDDTNFRVWMSSVDEAIKGTSCAAGNTKKAAD